MNEFLLQEMLCRWMKFQYPDVLFRSDLGGIRLTLGQATKVKRTQAGRAWPDLFIARPIGRFHGLFLELKAEGATVWLKNGELSSNKHIREQAEVLNELAARGYSASFAVGFEEAKAIITHYLGGILEPRPEKCIDCGDLVRHGQNCYGGPPGHFVHDIKSSCPDCANSIKSA